MILERIESEGKGPRRRTGRRAPSANRRPPAVRIGRLAAAAASDSAATGPEAPQTTNSKHHTASNVTLEMNSIWCIIQSIYFT